MQVCHQTVCPLDFKTASALEHFGLALMPGPACSTSIGEEQQAESNDQPSVICPAGQKPSFMTELEPGSALYFKAFVKDENGEELKLRFPGG